MDLLVARGPPVLLIIFVLWVITRSMRSDPHDNGSGGYDGGSDSGVGGGD